MNRSYQAPLHIALHALLFASIMTVAGNRVEATTTITLGTAETFAVLASSAVANTGSTVLFGDVGVSPSGAITGFAPGVVTGGTIHLNDSIAADALADASAAYVQLAGLASTQVLTGQDLGGLTLTPGVYFFAATAGLTGTLTLDGGNQSDARFVFQIGSTLTTGVSSINLINGATAADIWFQVGSSATLGMGTDFSGSIIASASNTLASGVVVDGRIIALTGAVTLADNQITRPEASVPEPATTVLIASGLALLSVVGRRHRNKQAA